MVSYRVELGRGWLLGYWLEAARVFAKLIHRHTPIAITGCASREAQGLPRHLSIALGYDVPAKAELHALALHTERLPQCLERYGEALLARRAQALDVLLRVGDRLRQCAESGDVEFLQRLTAWLADMETSQAVGQQCRAAS